MRKFISVLLTALIAVGCLSGCGSAAASDTAAKNASDTAAASAGGKNLQIVTTIFPEYDWVMNVLGDNPAAAGVTMLLDNGVDLHSFQPSAEDILKISSCDLFIYVGGESDDWVDDALEEAVNKDMKVINLLEVLGDSVQEEEIVEGMEHDHDHEHEHEEDEEAHEHEDAEEEHEHEHEHEETEYDEHVWLSLRHSAVIVDSISEALQSLDAGNADIYKENASAYIEKLNALDQEYQSAVSAASFDTVLFGDRFPFRYLTDDYGLTYYAAFVGCSAETEASFETITFLAQKVDELGLPAILTIEGPDHKIAETIAENTKAKNQKILTMDSMQGTTIKDVEAGITYLSVMESNLAVLKEALN